MITEEQLEVAHVRHEYEAGDDWSGIYRAYRCKRCGGSPLAPVHGKRGRPRVFVLVRDEDVTGVSGTGEVAWGVHFPDGRVALRFATEISSTIEDVVAIHGHDGRTRVEWLD